MIEKKPKILGKKDKCDTALLLIDIINDIDFEGNEAIVEGLPELTKNLKLLKAKARRHHIPAIYVNDNFNMWLSNLEDLLTYCTREDSFGRELVEQMKPNDDDYFVLKPMHSGFFGTPLAILLSKLGVKRLILAGLAADICVLYTANDAYMHNFEIAVVSDCVMSNTADEKKNALEHMRKRLKAKILSCNDVENLLEANVGAAKI